MENLDWSIVSILVTFAVAWSGVILWAVKSMQHATREQISNMFLMLQKKIDEQDQRIEKIDRDVMTLRADLPREYVMREDWIRFNSIIDARLETMNEKLSRLLERGDHNE